MTNTETVLIEMINYHLRASPNGQIYGKEDLAKAIAAKGVDWYGQKHKRKVIYMRSAGLIGTRMDSTNKRIILASLPNTVLQELSIYDQPLIQQASSVVVCENEWRITKTMFTTITVAKAYNKPCYVIRGNKLALIRDIMPPKSTSGWNDAMYGKVII